MSEPSAPELCAVCKKRHPADYYPRLQRIKMRPTKDCKNPRIQGPGEPGSPYYPSNGTEGDLFTERWCERCLYWNRAEVDPEVDIACPIYVHSLMTEYGKGPNQWVHGEDGWGECTMFDSRKPLEIEQDGRRHLGAEEERELYAQAMRGE